jgi:hypothetical protein
MTLSYFLKIRFNIFPSTLGSSKWSLSLRFFHQNTVHTSTHLHTCYMFHSFYFSWILSCSMPHVFILYIHLLYLFPMAQQPTVGQGLFTKASWSHSETHALGRTPLDEWSETSTWQHSQQTNIHAPGGMQTHNPLDGVATHIGCRLCLYNENKLVHNFLVFWLLLKNNTGKS